MKEGAEKQEFTIIAIFAVFISFCTIVINIFSMYNIDKMHTITKNIYNHPLKVSNAALRVDKNVIKMHRDMKDVVLYVSKEKLEQLQREIDSLEKEVYEDLNIIKHNILGKEGLALHKLTYQLFFDWKDIRNEVHTLVENNKLKQAIEITKNKGAKHVEKLEDASYSLNIYANEKADIFKNNSHDMFDFFQKVSYFLTAIFLIIIFAFVLYVRVKIRRYILIRAKDKEKFEHLSQRLEHAVHATGDGLWDWNLTANEVYFSPQWKEMLGFKDEELPNEFASWKDRVHPDDLEMAEKAILASHEKAGISYEIIHRLRHKDGSWVWVLDRGKTIFDENDKAIRMIGFHTDITKLKHQEMKIEELGTLLQNTINSVENLIFVKDKEFRYIECNEAFEKFTGYSREELIGKSDYDLFDKETADFFRSKDESMLESEVSQENYEWVTYPDDSKVFLLTNKTPLRDQNFNVLGLVGNSVNMTEHERLENELREAKEQFEHFMQYIPANIYILQDKKVLYSNHLANKFFGRESIVGLETQDLFFSDELEKINDFCRITFEVGVHEEIVSLSDALKEKKKHRVYAFKMDATQNPRIGIVSIDITDEYNMKLELEENEEMMIAQSRHAAMGEMISMIAHQWRQPISVIAMNANNTLVDIELELSNDAALKESSLNIIHLTEELSKTIDDFRDFFKPDKTAETILLETILDDALRVIGQSLEFNNVKLTIEPVKDVSIKTYVRELMQVLINLIKNAKEAFKEKQEEKEVLIKQRLLDNKVEITVQDNAGGIETSIIDKIFDPYFSTKGEKNGTGLGLYMSKTIIEKHLGGVLSVKNMNDGACFFIELPMSVNDED